MTVDEEFGSDNHSGTHPDILKAIQTANKGYATAYGEDKYTKGAVKKFKDLFGANIDVYFVYNGTAANILGLKTVTDSFNSIITAETAHMEVHECCGPEKFTGCKLTVIPTKDGKLTVDMIKPYIVGFGDVHMAQPKVISITQPTEMGTVYTIKEIKKLADFAHKNKMLLHVDGARICNAVVSQKCSMKKMTADAGVDILSFGGTKNGMMFGEAVIFFDKKISKNFEFYRKQGMHLASKMRFISAQFEEFLSNDLWAKNAKHANKMAQLLKKEVSKIPKVKIAQKLEVNAVFAKIPEKYIKPLNKKYFFHTFDEENSIVRWMCSFNTTEEEVLKFAETIRQTIK